MSFSNKPDYIDEYLLQTSFQLDLKKFHDFIIASGLIAIDLKPLSASVVLMTFVSKRLSKNLSTSQLSLVQDIPLRRFCLSVATVSFLQRYKANFHSFSPPSRIAVQQMKFRQPAGILIRFSKFQSFYFQTFLVYLRIDCFIIHP